MFLTHLLLSALAAAPTAGDEFALRAEVLHLGDGTRIENGIVLIADGKLREVGAAAVPEGMRVVEHAGHVGPGLIAPWAPGLMPSSERNETTRPFFEDLRLVHGFDPAHEAVADALAAGVTTVQILGSPRDVVAGRTAVVKTASEGALANLLLREGALMVNVDSNSANNDRFPTSYAGISVELQARLAAGEGVWGEVQSGQRAALVGVRDRHDVLRAISIFGPTDARLVLAGAQLAGELADEIEASGAAAIAPPLEPGATARAVDALRELADSDVPFAFGLGDPETFRFAAAAALRDGADEASVRRAFCADAAALLGLESRIGRLAAGLDADLVLWSGDPLNLTSGVDAVYVDGRLVHEAAANASAHAQPTAR